MTSEVMVGRTAPGHPPVMYKLALPLVALVAFTIYTLLVATEHGLWALVPLHMVGGWPTQVFIDLVLALSGFLALAVPDARRRGIDVRPFVVATVLLGSIGMLAYIVRRQLGESRRLASA